MSTMCQRLPPSIRQNDEILRIVLVQTEQMDSRLAEILWECYSRGFYKAFGFRNVRSTCASGGQGRRWRRLGR